MKRIGDVMRNIPIRPPSESGQGAIVLSNRDTVRCPICQDAGYLRGDYPVGHPLFGKVYPCECKEREIRERDAERFARVSNLDLYADQTFETFDSSIDGVGEAYEAALRFAQDHHSGWLFLTGPCGTGKTHLAAAVANYHLRVHKGSVFFAVVPDLLDHLRATYDPSAATGYDELFARVKGAMLLVLDDLGTENATPWAREKLYQVINHRYMEQMPTVVTSNVDLRKVDDRIMSRILDHRLSVHIEMDAEDYRRPGQVRQLRKAGRR